MVVDDDRVFNLMAKILLRDTGIADNPISCTNGQEAITLLEEQQPTNQSILLLLDINMPVMDGWDVLEALQTLPDRQKIHVVIVTSSIDKADREKAHTYGQLISYLVKPIKRENLVALKTTKALAPFFPSR